MNKKMNKKGFTLIELIVVIAIIGLLSTLAVLALGSVYSKGRDARRLSDLKQLQTALEFYNTDQNSYPPIPNNGANLALGQGSGACLNTAGFVILANCGATPYMGQVPDDPKFPGTYVYTVANNSYKITANLEGTVNGLSGGIKLTPSGISLQP